jgi:hypothetical protein
MLGHPGLGLGGGAVIDRYLMAGGGDMSSHGIAHDTKTEKSDVCHDVEIPVEDSCSAATRPEHGMAGCVSVIYQHVGASLTRTICRDDIGCGQLS